ncbi:MAG: hypothetical protein ABEJ58_00975 [Halodesulfurarchaeum sp.]
MDEKPIHAIAHYNSKTDQVYINLFEDPEIANQWATERREERDIEAVLHKVMTLPKDFSDDMVEEWRSHLE